MMNYLNNKRFLILIIVLLIIISITGAIYIIDSKKTTSNLVDYNNLKEKSITVSKMDKVSNNQRFNVFLKNIESLNNPNLTKDEQLKKIKIAWNYLYVAYSESNDPELYKLSVEFKKFIDANFADTGYKVYVLCLDSTCAEKPIPQQILGVIDEINKSDLSTDTKNDFISLLKTFSYLNDADTVETKVIDFLGLAASISVDPDFIKAGVNTKISNEIRDYIKTTYPELYTKYSEKIKIQPPIEQ